MSVSRERNELRGQFLDGRYRIGNAIGMGGTGIVFEAERLATLERVVVKMLRPTHAGNPDLMSRVRREVEVARRVVHPGIVPVIDHGSLPDESPYLVMKYMRSESLSSYLRRCGPLDAAWVSVIMARLASILHSVHRHGYVHRDIKPEHILLNRGGYGELDVHLLDFGVCAAETAPADERARERGRVYGTPNYASPEQASGNPFVDARADLFAVGVTMFEALTGKRVLERYGLTETVINCAVRFDTPQPAGTVGPALDGVEVRQLTSGVASLYEGTRRTAARWREGVS